MVSKSKPGTMGYSTPRCLRKRKGIELMLSDVAQEKLDRVAKERGVSRSAVVEWLIMEVEW